MICLSRLGRRCAGCGPAGGASVETARGGPGPGVMYLRYTFHVPPRNRSSAVDAQVSAVLGRVMAQRRTVATAADYVRGLSAG